MSFNNVQNFVKHCLRPTKELMHGDLPHLKARKNLADAFKRKILYDNPVRFYSFSEGDLAAARKAKGN